MILRSESGDRYSWLYLWSNLSSDVGYDAQNKEWWRKVARNQWERCSPGEVPKLILENKLIVFG